MFGINDRTAQAFHSRSPHTFAALQHVVMAMDDVANAKGKRTWFGRDKIVNATANLEVAVVKAVIAMDLDDIVSSAMSNEELAQAMKTQLDQFFEAFPTWMQARVFAEVFFAQPDAVDYFRSLRPACLGQAPQRTRAESAPLGKIVIECVTCQQKLRVTPGRNMVAACPRCGSEIALDVAAEKFHSGEPSPSATGRQAQPSGGKAKTVIECRNCTRRMRITAGRSPPSACVFCGTPIS
jgi:hypothetical protein